jgi:carbon monoxide dehydrogenase subunit G
MELNHSFTVELGLEDAWTVLTDLERIAPCLPGAQLQEIEGDIYRGMVKVKVGPISASFKGQATFQERDDAQHRAVLKGEGRDTGGKGNASALITAQLESVSDGVTSCTVHTDLTITGKVAQFGRGALADVSEKLLAQFTKNLSAMLAEQGAVPAAGDTAPEEAPPAPAESESPSETEPAPAGEDETGATAAPAQEPTVRKIDAPANEPIDLLGTAGAPMLKRIAPVVAVVLVLVLLLRRRRR